MLTTMKFLFFAVTFVTVFGVFATAFAQSSAFENLHAAVYPLYPDLVYFANRENRSSSTPEFIKTTVTVSGVEFTLYGAHYYSNPFGDTVKMDIWIEISGDLGSDNFVWQDYELNTYLTAYRSAVVEIAGKNIVTVQSDWSIKNNMVFKLGNVYPAENFTGTAMPYYASAIEGQEVVYQKDFAETLISGIGEFVMFVPRILIGGLFGKSGDQFVNTMVKVITCDFPGTPTPIRLMVAVPIAFMIVYVGLIIIRSFIPTVGGGSWG